MSTYNYDTKEDSSSIASFPTTIPADYTVMRFFPASWRPALFPFFSASLRSYFGAFCTILGFFFVFPIELVPVLNLGEGTVSLPLMGGGSWGAGSLYSLWILRYVYLWLVYVNAGLEIKHDFENLIEAHTSGVLYIDEKHPERLQQEVEHLISMWKIVSKPRPAFGAFGWMKEPLSAMAYNSYYFFVGLESLSEWEQIAHLESA